MGITGDEREELRRLRVEVDQLRATLARAGPAEPAVPVARRRKAGSAGRWSAAVVLLLISALVGVAAVTAGFLRDEVLDTDQYVRTVAPLARDPQVRDAVAQRVSDELVTQLDLAGLTQQLVDALKEQGAPELLDGLVTPITQGLRSFLDSEIRALLATDEFARIWDAANRAVHDELDALLTTGHGDLSAVQDDTLVLNLGALFTLLKQRLAEAGFTLVEDLPEISVTVPVASSEQIPRIRGWVRWLDAAARVLPFLAVGLLAAGLATAPDRRRGLFTAAVAWGVGMLLLLGAIAVGQVVYLDRLPAQLDSPGAASVVFETLLRFLVASARTFALLSALVAVGCWLAGPSRPATGLRRAGSWLLDHTASGVDRTGLRLGALPGRVRSYRRPIEVLLALLAGAAVLWWRPGLAGTGWIGAGLLVGWFVVEVLARSRPPEAARAGYGSTAAAPGG